MTGKKIYDTPAYNDLGSTPISPPTGFWKIYPRSGAWYVLDDAGTETPLATGTPTLAGVMSVDRKVDASGAFETFSGEIIANFNQMELYSLPSGLFNDVKLNWEYGTLATLNAVSVDWRNRYLETQHPGANRQVLTWGAGGQKLLYYEPSGPIHTSLDWTLGKAYDIVANETLDYNTRNLLSAWTIAGNFAPEADGTRDLGTSTESWANLYLSSNIHYKTDLTFQNLGNEKMRLTTSSGLLIGRNTFWSVYSDTRLTLESSTGSSSSYGLVISRNNAQDVMVTRGDGRVKFGNGNFTAVTPFFGGVFNYQWDTYGSGTLEMLSATLALNNGPICTVWNSRHTGTPASDGGYFGTYDNSHLFLRAGNLAAIMISGLADSVQGFVSIGVTLPTPTSGLTLNGSLATNPRITNASENVDAYRHVVFQTATGNTLTLDAASTCPGREYQIVLISGGIGDNVTITSSGGNIIGDGSAPGLSKLFTNGTLNKNLTIILKSDGTNWNIISIY